MLIFDGSQGVGVWGQKLRRPRWFCPHERAIFVCKPAVSLSAQTFSPIPPSPFPEGRGRFFNFICREASPLHPVSKFNVSQTAVRFAKITSSFHESSPQQESSQGVGVWGQKLRRPRWFCPHERAIFVCKPAVSLSAQTFSPIPPSPFPEGRGRFFNFICREASPPAPRVRTKCFANSREVCGNFSHNRCMLNFGVFFSTKF